MRLLDWFKSLWSPSPAPPMEEGLTRRAFLGGLTASVTAAFLTPSLPPVPEPIRKAVADITGLLEAQFEIIEHVYQRALWDIMAAEDARFLAYVDAVLEAA